MNAVMVRIHAVGADTSVKFTNFPTECFTSPRFFELAHGGKSRNCTDVTRTVM